MKKLLTILALLLCMISLASCNNDKDDAMDNEKETVTEKANNDTVTEDIEKEDDATSSLSSAAWEGYDKVPFIEFLETALEKIPAPVANIQNHQISVFPGWDKSESLKEIGVTEGETKATYSLNAEVVNPSTGEVESGEILMFVVIDNSTNTFHVLSANTPDGTLGPEEIAQGLELIRSIAEGEMDQIFSMYTSSELENIPETQAELK